MEKSATVSASYFIVCSMFLFYQQTLIKQFQGASRLFLIFLTWFAFGGYIAQITYFVYYGWNVSWVDSLLISVGGVLMAGFLGTVLERMVGKWVIVFMGFLGVPYCGYMMFKTIPMAA